MQEANQKNREKRFIQHKVYAPIASRHVDVDVSQITCSCPYFQHVRLGKKMF